MEKKFSLYEQLETNLEAIDKIDDSVKITLGPTGKTGIFMNTKNRLTFLTNGAGLLQSLEFEEDSANVILKLLEQSATKTSNISGDGSTTTVLLACQLLKTSLRFLVNGYNPVFLGNGLRKLSYFLNEKVVEFSLPIQDLNQILGILKTTIGKKINNDLFDLLKQSLSQIGRDGLILVEENISEKNELQIVQGIELDRGYASSYFVNDLKSFEVTYTDPLILIASTPLNSVNQIRDIIDHVKANNKPLVVVAEEINKDVISTLVLNNMQKKFKVVVVKFAGIKFLKSGVLEDLSTLTFSNYFVDNVKEENKIYKISDLGQAEKVIIRKEKSTFIISKFSKIIAKRKINELNRELLQCETEYEKDIFKARIARLSGNIAKIKLGLSNQYEMDEQRKKVEGAVNTIKSALEEGVLPGGGSFYLYLREEVNSWSTLNLIGEEYFASLILLESLVRPFKELFNNSNLPSVFIQEELSRRGFPIGYNLTTKQFVNSFEEGLLDSAKTVRAALWNSLTIVSTIITSD